MLHQVDIAAGMVARYREAKLADGPAIERVLAAFAEVAAAYPRDAVVACHNDVKAANIVFDGVRPWFVDWEAAFSNDRYADLANIASFYCSDAATRMPSSRRTSARRRATSIARASCSCGSSCTCRTSRTSACSRRAPACRPARSRRPTSARSTPVSPTRSIDVVSAERKQQYANVHLAAADALVASPRFAASLARVREGA